MSHAILIPFRDNGDGVRSRLWHYCEWRLKASGITYYVADDDGSPGQPFNIGKARNEAFRQSTEDILLIMDADHIVQPLAVEAVLDKLASRNLPWAPIFSTNGVFDYFQTEAIFSNRLDPLTAVPELTSPYCTSPLAVRREVWDDVGGQPEDYNGWGAEDVQFRATLQALYPIAEDDNPSAMNLCLFHQWAKVKDPWGEECWQANLNILHHFEEVLAEGPEAVRSYVESHKVSRS